MLMTKDLLMKKMCWGGFCQTDEHRADVEKVVDAFLVHRDADKAGKHLVDLEWEQEAQKELVSTLDNMLSMESVSWKDLKNLVNSMSEDELNQTVQAWEEGGSEWIPKKLKRGRNGEWSIIVH